MDRCTITIRFRIRWWSRPLGVLAAAMAALRVPGAARLALFVSRRGVITQVA